MDVLGGCSRKRVFSKKKYVEVVLCPRKTVLENDGVQG